MLNKLFYRNGQRFILEALYMDRGKAMAQLIDENDKRTTISYSDLQNNFTKTAQNTNSELE